MNSFSELNLTPVLQVNLKKHGYTTPTPVQAQSIPPALAGRDVVATAQTGTGKTLSFVVPMLTALAASTDKTSVQAVIMLPTRELAIQIHEAFTKVSAGTGVRSVVVVGGLEENAQIRKIRQGAQVLIATPGRLRDFVDRRVV